MMKNKWVRKLIIGLGIVMGVILLVNFAINIYLKYQLPKVIQKNSDYTVKYKSLNVDLGTGNILATGIQVQNKNPNNRNVIGLEGTVDSLKISRFGMYDALYSKIISSDDLLMSKPKLKITLAKPVNEKTGKKPNPVKFENIRINDGTIAIYKHDNSKFFSVQNLKLDVENLQMTEESLENELPVVFDHYDIQGDDFYFRPDARYAIFAKKVATDNAQMVISQFQLLPQLSKSDFIRLFPNEKSMFTFKAQAMTFKDIALKKKNLSLSKINFINPELTIETTNAKPKKSNKPLAFEVSLDEVQLANAKIRIKHPNDQDFVNIGSMTMDVQKIKLNQETAQKAIPFVFEKLVMKGSAVDISTDEQTVHLANFALNEKSGDFRNLVFKSKTKQSQKTVADMSLNRLNLKLNSWGFEDKKLKLDVNSVLLEQLNGTITSAATNQSKKKASYDGIYFPLKVGNVMLKNSNITYDKGNQPLEFKKLNASIKNIEMNEQTVKSAIPFKSQAFSVSSQNFKYKTKYYDIASEYVQVDKDQLKIGKFSLKPRYTRAQFIRMIPSEKDLYTLSINQILMKGDWNLVSSNQYINATQVTLDGMTANIFRSKVPKDDVSIKPLYSAALRSIKFPMYIANLDVKNSKLEYEEDTPKSDGPGILTFSSFNLNAKHLNSGKMKGKPTAIPITIQCKFFEVSPMSVRWNMNTADHADNFSIAGNFSNLPAVRINQFVEPYLKIRTTGTIQDLKFDFKGNKNGIGGKVNMQHKDFKVSILKQDGGKNKILSSVANIFVKTNSGDYPQSVVVEGVKRDPTKSFFNLFWKGIEEGLAKTLVGTSIVKTKEKVGNVKETSKNVKEAVRDAGQKAGDAVKNVTKPATTAENENTQESKKNGLFKNLFKKKEKADE